MVSSKLPRLCVNRLAKAATFTADILSDLILVALPLYVLYHTSLPVNERRLFRTIFAASILTCLASIVYAVFLFGAKFWGMGSIVGMTSHLEVTTFFACDSCTSSEIY